jgi:hypothetical protein
VIRIFISYYAIILLFFVRLYKANYKIIKKCIYQIWQAKIPQNTSVIFTFNHVAGADALVAVIALKIFSHLNLTPFA